MNESTATKGRGRWWALAVIALVAAGLLPALRAARFSPARALWSL